MAEAGLVVQHDVLGHGANGVVVSACIGDRHVALKKLAIPDGHDRPAEAVLSRTRQAAEYARSVAGAGVVEVIALIADAPARIFGLVMDKYDANAFERFV